MLDETGSLPEDPEDLRAFTARLLAEVKAQAILIEKLRHQLAGLRAHRFGASSETVDQLQLALETSEIAAAAMTARLHLPDVEPKDRPKRRPIPDHISRMEVELTTGEESCFGCGRTLRRLGEDVTEELEYVPRRLAVNRIVRPRFACSSCDCFVQALLPSRPIERGRPGPGLLAHVLVSKYADHLPLYRQSQIFEREGIDLDRSTLADWVASRRLFWSRWPQRRAARFGRRGDLCGWYSGQDVGAWHRQDADRAALDLRPRRTPLGGKSTACRMVSLLCRPQGAAPQGSSDGL